MLYESFSSMLGPAVNRQPGFRREIRRAKQRSEEHCLLQTCRCCNLAADLPDQLAGNPARCCLPTLLPALAGCSISVCLFVSLARLAQWLADDAAWRVLTQTAAGCFLLNLLKLVAAPTEC